MNYEGYKRRREEEIQWIRGSNELLYGFFGKQVSVREVQLRLNQQVKARVVNKMKSEIAELNATR
jgi:hypothetical protein